MQEFIAGAFFADDRVIWEAVPYEQGRRPPFPSRFNDERGLLERSFTLPGHSRDGSAAGPSLQDCLTQSLLRISEIVPKGGLRSLCIAMPGPIRGSGQSGATGEEILTDSFHRKGEQWSKQSIGREIDEAFKEAKLADLMHGKFRKIIYTDAAAYAVGDYWVSSPARWSGRRPTFAHVTVDEGVGAAIVRDGRLMDMEQHAEIGHIPVRKHPDDKDFDGMCSAHRFTGCLESYVSLPAMRARWGEEEVSRIKYWPRGRKRLQIVAFYLAQLCVHLVLTYNVTHIGFSGRVTRNKGLMSLVREITGEALSIPGNEERRYPGYDTLQEPSLRKFIGYVKNQHAGVFGCVLLAYELAEK